jgi:hypothetical protein
LDERQRKADVAWAWYRAAGWLRWYVEHGSLAASFAYFRYREGRWVLARVLLLCVCTYVAALGDWLHGVIVALYLAADLLIFNTAVVFVTRQPLNVFRSILLTMAGYPTLALAFAPGWLSVGCCGSPERDLWSPVPRGIAAVHRSLGALTSAGPDNPSCVWARILGITEALVGIYFVLIIVAAYLSWMKSGQAP